MLQEKYGMNNLLACGWKEVLKLFWFKFSLCGFHPIPNSHGAKTAGPIAKKFGFS
jgi:hypothetical protein